MSPAMEGDDGDDMIMIIVEDEDANDKNQAVAFPMPIKEEQVDESNWDPESILETAELHGQYVTFIKKEEQSIEEEYFEYDYLEDCKKELEQQSSDEEEEILDAETKPRQSYIDQLRKNFPKMRKDDEYLITHLTEMMKQTKPPNPPIDFCQSVNDMLVCSYCGVESPTLPIACRHYQKKHGTRYLVCYACGSTFKCTTGLYKHEKRCPRSGAALVLRARGRYLGRKGRTRPFLTRNKFHPWGAKVKEPEKKRFFCSECTASFRNREALRSHEYMHRGERPYQCDQCPVAYTSSIALRRHLQIHSDSEYICDVCGHSFKVKTTLIVHMNTHLPQRKYPCDRCERRFAQKNALQHHINRDHLNIPPPLVCAVCPKRFPRVSNLNAHMKAKHGLTVMTRRMFFKALPSMKDTELKKATVVFSQNEPDVMSIEAVSSGNDPSNESKKKVVVQNIRQTDKQDNKIVKVKNEMDTKIKHTTQDKDMLNTTNDLVKIKKAVKTTLPNSCELEFVNFINYKESPEPTKTQSRIPRVDLSLARTPKQNRGPKVRNQTPKIDINVARMHEKIRETCGRNMPELTTDVKIKEVKNEEENVINKLLVIDTKADEGEIKNISSPKIMTRSKAMSEDSKKTNEGVQLRRKIKTKK